jgi:hypothetical protein
LASLTFLTRAVLFVLAERLASVACERNQAGDHDRREN